jgi:serine/threonine protein kinase
MRSSIGSFTNLFKAAGDRDNQKVQKQGTFVGTALYVAPEMLEYNNSGKYTDLWALGCIIYQMLVGKSPFQAKTKDKVF